MNNDPFFVGYLPAPGALRRFLLLACVLLVSGLAATGFLMGWAQDDPGPGAFRFDYGRQTVTGVVELTPYPVLHVTEGNDRIKPGDSFMMTAGGKSGVDGRAAPLEGQLARVSGVVLERGRSQHASVARRAQRDTRRRRGDQPARAGSHGALAPRRRDL